MQYSQKLPKNLLFTITITHGPTTDERGAAESTSPQRAGHGKRPRRTGRAASDISAPHDRHARRTRPSH
ncbi:MAG: hypothetical protein V3R99_06340 [Thermoguttaceae bacterium]